MRGGHGKDWWEMGRWAWEYFQNSASGKFHTEIKWIEISYGCMRWESENTSNSLRFSIGQYFNSTTSPWSHTTQFQILFFKEGFLPCTCTSNLILKSKWSTAPKYNKQTQNANF